MNDSFLWYDYETFGTNPAKHWPAQFAGIRTDSDFNEMEDPLEIYSKLPDDQLPDPESCLITGITPDLANERGVCEAEFIGKINAVFSVPRTCVLGYNTLRFDDEVTRYSLYRNFMDPYEREWKNGCNRWDLIDVVRTYAALYPGGIEWPVKEDGVTSFKLEELTVNNGITHGQAHDAVSDVRATIGLGKFLKTKKQELFQYLLKSRSKQEVLKIINVKNPRPIVHVSGRVSSKNYCLVIVAPIFDHPTNNNGVVVFDLNADPSAFWSLSEEQLEYRMYTKNQQLEQEGLKRLPVKIIHRNKCPIVLPYSVFKKGDIDKERLLINESLLKENFDKLTSNNSNMQELKNKLKNIYSKNNFELYTDPDLMLYSGGFFDNSDKRLMQEVNRMSPEELKTAQFSFKDKRLKDMLFRYRARNWPDFLNKKECEEWQQFCYKRLCQSHDDKPCQLDLYFQKIIDLSSMGSNDAAKQKILENLTNYGKRRKNDIECTL